MKSKYFLPIVLLLMVSCGKDSGRNDAAGTDKPAIEIKVPPFNADSAYAFVAKQVGFGPRIPNTPAHGRAADYFVETLKRFG